ncbi:hypothetical protein [Marinobacter fonticola]|uniref:hypothetical protein n=1 Tax=Marinobacter fonticola TaxID=2603215 RepID=UPI0011E6A4B4|nr:hypothetical protein [Marinobacter fonticola]
MIRALFCAASVLFFSGCASIEADAESKYIKVIYSGLTFRLPPDPLIVGSLGGESNILVFEYSKDPGKYIGYTTDRDLRTGNCEPTEFFRKSLSNDASDSDCPNEIKTFNQVFSRDRETGAWTGTDQEFYYFISRDHRSSFIFFVTDDGTIRKMESDFLKKSDFKKALAQYL